MKAMKVYKVEVKKGPDGLRWNAHSRNGTLIAAGEQGFSQYRGVLRSTSLMPEIGEHMPISWERGAKHLVVIVPKNVAYWDPVT